MNPPTQDSISSPPLLRKPMHGGLKALIGGVCLMLILGGVGLFLAIYFRVSGGYGIYQIPTRGMAPTLERADQVLGLSTRVGARELLAGEVVMFRMPFVKEHPEYEGQVFVQRIAALSGQHVEVKASGLWVDGKEFTAANEFGTLHYTNVGTDEKSFTVPPASAFKVGDNTRASYDGRYWPPSRYGIIH